MNINEIKNLIESLEGNVSFVSNDIFKDYMIRHQSIFDEIIKIDPPKILSNAGYYVIIFYKLKMLIEFCSKAFYIDLKVFSRSVIYLTLVHGLNIILVVCPLLLFRAHSVIGKF